MDQWLVLHIRKRAVRTLVFSRYQYRALSRKRGAGSHLVVGTNCVGST